MLNAPSMVFSPARVQSDSRHVRRPGGSPQRRSAIRTALATCVVVAAVFTSACSTDPFQYKSAAVTTGRSASPDSSNSHAAEIGADQTPLSTREYRPALRALASSDTGRFQLLVVRRMDSKESEVAQLPRMEGAWQLSTSDASSSTWYLDPVDGVIEVQYRRVDGQAFVRASFDGSTFGDYCWAKLDSNAPELTGSPIGGREFGLPSALYLFDGYRPAGRPAAGTAALDDVLGAIGFQRVANTAQERLQKVRLPIEVQLKDGLLYRVVIYPSDLLHALDSVHRDAPDVTKLQDLIADTPVLFWIVEYSGFGDNVGIVQPPSDRLIEPGASDSC